MYYTCAHSLCPPGQAIAPSAAKALCTLLGYSVLKIAA